MVKNNYFNRFRKKGKGKPKAKAKKVNTAPRMTFAQKVQKIIASNVENKYTKTASSISAIARLTSTGGPLPTPIVTTFGWYTYCPQLLDTIFDISQGPGETQRIGNKIKLKRWVIKGAIQPTQEFISGFGGSAASNSTMGYVDVYFGRYVQNTAPIQSSLQSLYQNGAVDANPTGSQGDKLARINKNLYKIYWHKRFKVGMGTAAIYNPSPPLYTAFNGVTLPTGEGFKPAVTFGFDVCKFICKNRIINYDEVDPSPQDPMLKNLTLFATFIPVAQNLSYNGTPGAEPLVNDTFYEILTSTYAEYEDA